ncbi:MAG TPA: DNA translocase FtsK 4TM domain-containing protein [Candidatus Paceibacterota bacterium]|jgi:S-DNA-T family DNA segregation ATPase FtsK/SpoIIIE|nr:DNA translocase FtsK 4TM domain-containing protein [Candidatus Paceibacterota bacterium]
MKDKKRAKKNGKSSAQVKIVERRVSSEAWRGVGAILFLAIAGFLVIAELGGGGAVGQSLFGWLTYLLGIGYWLLPLSFALLAVLVFRSFDERFGFVQVLGLAVFLLSALGLVDLAFPGKGGVLGASVSDPLVSAVATPATIVFLAAFMIAALVISFDANLPALFAAIREWFRSEEKEFGLEVDDVPVTGIHEEDIADMEEQPSEENYEETVPERRPAVSNFNDRSEPTEAGFPIIAATGSAYEPPPVSLLSKNKGKPEVGDVKANMNIIKRTLQNFGIQVEMDEASIGPTVTRYSMKPAEGVRLAKIVALQSNLELALAASPVRIEAPIPGKSLVGIEVPNIARTTLGLAPLVSDEQYTSSDKPLMVALGRSITGQAHFADLAKMPHMLVAGATGAGKSVAIHDFIISLLYRCGPERLRFIMVDPKRVELTIYNSIPHLLTPVITDAKKAILAMKWLAKEMERRYNILETEKVRDIGSYHANIVAPTLERGLKEGEQPPEAMPYIVVIIDELADIMSAYPRELEAGIVRLAQMSRAVGIHLILSTQRPSVKVITGLIKANIPARVAMQVASQIDSRTILDTGGAEKLLGAGDMLFLSGEMSKPRRMQAPYLSESEVKKVVSWIAKNAEGTLTSEIDFTDTGKIGGGLDTVFSSMADEEEEDELYGEAKKTVIEAGKASTSYLQRKLGIGYARAAKLIDMLEERGVVGPADGAKPRDVIGAGNADDLVKAAEESDEEAL